MLPRARNNAKQTAEIFIESHNILNGLGRGLFNALGMTKVNLWSQCQLLQIKMSEN